MKSRFYILAVLLFFPFVLQGQHWETSASMFLLHENGRREFRGYYYDGSFYNNDIDYSELKDARGNYYYGRYENNRIIRLDSLKEEFVLCDFNLNTGDVFQTKDGRQMKVYETGDSIFPQLFQSKNPFHYLKLENTDNPDDKDLWVRPFGSYYNFLMLPEEIGDDIVERVLFWVYSWNTDPFNRIPMSHIVNTINKPDLKTQLMKVEKEGETYYDPVNNKIIYETDSLNCEFKDDTLVISGRFYSNCGANYLTCDVVDNSILLSVSEVPPSKSCENTLYFTAKFPGFLPGEYSFEFSGPYPSDPPIITGNLVCKDYTDIFNIDYGNKNNHTIYDLQGRRLKQVPERGIYIQDRKKVIK